MRQFSKIRFNGFWCMSCCRMKTHLRRACACVWGGRIGFTSIVHIVGYIFFAPSPEVTKHSAWPFVIIIRWGDFLLLNIPNGLLHQLSTHASNTFARRFMVRPHQYDVFTQQSMRTHAHIAHRGWNDKAEATHKNETENWILSKSEQSKKKKKTLL